MLDQAIAGLKYRVEAAKKAGHDQMAWTVAEGETMLDALAAKDKQIAELTAGWGNCQKMMGVYCHAYEEAKDHIVDLNDQLQAVKKNASAWFKGMENAVRIGARYEERIAELAARTEQQPVAYIIQDADARRRGESGILRYFANISDEDINEYEITITPLVVAGSAPAAQPVTVTKEHSRQLFEQWCTVNKERNKYHPDYYAHLPAREQWAAWQAAMAAAGITIAKGE